MLSDAELAAMRSTIEEMLPDVCHILDVTHTSDGQGGYSDTYGTATANVACRLDANQQGRDREQLAGGAISPFTYWLLTLPHGTALSSEQVVAMVGGGTFNVKSVDAGKSWGACVRATLAKI